jgi:hypothetical protein
MHSEPFSFEVERIEALFRRIANDRFIFSGICNQQTQPADIVHDAGCIGDIGESLAGAGDSVGKYCGSDRVFPAAAQLGCA